MRQFTPRPLCALKCPINARKDPGPRETLLSLAKSYLTRPLHPLIVNPADELLDGWRRWLGLVMLLGEDSEQLVPCMVTDEMLTPSEIIQVNLVSAMHRKDLTGEEQWQGILAMQAATTFKNQDLAEALNIDRGMVTRLLSPGRCSLAWQEVLVAGKVTITDCYEVSRQPIEHHDRLLEEKLNGKKRSARNGLESKPPKVKVAVGAMQAVLCGMKDMEEICGFLKSLYDDARRAASKKLSPSTWQKLRLDQAKGEAS